jgi:hypothetical protein
MRASPFIYSIRYYWLNFVLFMLRFISPGLYSLLFYLDKDEEQTADGSIHWFSELLYSHHSSQVTLLDAIGY